ncbi:M20 metallopeptidase family protein [Scopulibacillus cellulosilyticus]|uniref:M20 family metallopeptidase n=1 Tax=Scopulibacillus cellulosilyticus TaxID=2665665 RepID=A0ABW2Q095_9BACL
MSAVVSTELADWAIKHRRHLHQYPELSGKEFETCQYIKQCLTDLNIDILDYEPPSVVGYLKGTEDAGTVALRADIDALPILEEGDKSYISKRPGIAHMCGHDGHTAIMLATAKWLSEHRDEVKPNVIFIFQSSEEDFPSGAEALVKQGVVDHADAVFGLHLMQSLPKGKVGVCHGMAMSAADDFTITIQGKGGHGSMPHDTVDPTYIAGHIILALQSIVSRRLDPLFPAVVSIGKMEAGNAYNVIPDKVTIGGSIRSFSNETRSAISHEMEKIVKGICQSYDAAGFVEFGWGAPPVVNDREMSEYAKEIIIKTFGETVYERTGPMMASEDFSYYLEKQKGAYLFVGMGGEKSTYPHHHPRFDIDEDTIPTAIELFVQIVTKFDSAISKRPQMNLNE